MRKNLIIAVLIIILTSCNIKAHKVVSPKEIINYSFDTKALIKNIKTLSNDSFLGRRTGTEGAIKTKEYLINAFSKHNISPLFETFEQLFSFQVNEKTYNAANIIGFIKGTSLSKKCIVISAHYDHEGVKKGKIYNGSGDNASGTSALIAFAEYFKNNPPKNNVIIAAFDGEELGLKGANYFVKNLTISKQNIIVNLNMDMISRSDDNELFAVGTRYNNIFKDIVNNYNQVGKVSLIRGHEGLTPGDNWVFSSDHAAFFKENIPLIYFGVKDHKDYHKPTDDFDKIHQEFYKNAVQTIFNIFNKIDQL